MPRAEEESGCQLEMENITHSLVGLALGEVAVQLTGGDSSTRRRFWMMSLIANNFPDVDTVLGPVTGGKIGYLLQHRGYTHTFVMAIPQALFLWSLFWLWYRRRGGMGHGLVLLVLAVTGIGTHIALDSLNSYGVHPFWPWVDRWFYADTLFIVEPWIWLSLLPALYFSAPSPTIRLLLVGVFLLGTGVVWWAPYIPVVIALAMTTWACGLFYFSLGMNPKRRPGFGLAAALVVVGVFFPCPNTAGQLSWKPSLPPTPRRVSTMLF